jgi:hypothetical protein
VYAKRIAKRMNFVKCDICFIGTFILFLNLNYYDLLIQSLNTNYFWYLIGLLNL